MAKINTYFGSPQSTLQKPICPRPVRQDLGTLIHRAGERPIEDSEELRSDIRGKTAVPPEKTFSPPAQVLL